MKGVSSEMLNLAKKSQASLQASEVESNILRLLATNAEPGMITVYFESLIHV